MWLVLSMHGDVVYVFSATFAPSLIFRKFDRRISKIVLFFS